jgi:hypothetical protein
MNLHQADKQAVKTEIPDNNHFCLLEQTGNGTIDDDLSKLAGLQPLPDVQLLNYYKEVPVFATARILDVAENRVVCRTSEAQTRVIEFSRYTIIKGAPFQHHVYADAHHDPDTGKIFLSGLNYAVVHSDRRASVRVRLQVPAAISIEAGTTKFSGRMLDLSLDGCAVNIADRKYLENFSFFYLTIDMPFRSNQAAIKPRVMAKLAKVYQHNKLFRCVFLFEHDKSSEDQIGMLIARRQAEIIRELSS